jgi:hypothetical protein
MPTLAFNEQEIQCTYEKWSPLAIISPGPMGSTTSSQGFAHEANALLVLSTIVLVPQQAIFKVDGKRYSFNLHKQQAEKLWGQITPIANP